MNTPVFIFDKNELIKCYNEIKSQLGGIRVYYALKANANKDVLSVLSLIGADFEVASLGEFNALIDLGVPPIRIICGLPIKPIDWLKRMYEDGCRYFVFDTISELEKLVEYSPNAIKVLRVGINDILAESIEYGMPNNEIIDILQRNQSQIKKLTEGISFHISNNINIEGFNLVIKRIDEILTAFDKSNMILNIGGGYRINAGNDYFENLRNKIKELSMRHGVSIIAEPGNTIVNSAGCIRTSVIGIKKRSNYDYDLYIDAGKPTGIKTDEKRIPGYIKLMTNHEYCSERRYRFIDITCMHKPHFSIKLNSPVYDGDIFEFGDMGAYTLCLKSDFHAWAYPEVFVL
jgi:ornithine decarboxylase